MNGTGVGASVIPNSIKYKVWLVDF